MTVTSTISKLVLPRPPLAGCVAGLVVRDTRGCALDGTQRFNFAFASPLCLVYRVFAVNGI
jgi:hypothetical protein